MKRNPKTIVGLTVLVIMLAGLGFLITKLVPVWQETSREMSLTPTPLPPVPSSVMAVTPDPSQPTNPPVLKTGSRGQEVKDLQGRLHTLGYYNGELDGEFGPATKEAVIAFQKANGLGADGIVGEETKALLFSSSAKPYTGSE